MTDDLYGLHFDTALSPQQLFQAHVAYGRQFPAAPRPPRKANPKIRVGYVSGDFYSHAAAYFLLPLLDAHDRDKFEIFLYSKTKKIDAVTARFKQRGHWRELSANDGEAFQMIQADAIDILVDCSGHTPGNSLSLFALRPAPVSVTFLGYPNTTGLSQIDYRLTDKIIEPEGALATEQLVRLPHGIHTYRPLNDTDEPKPRSGPIVFANLGRAKKVTPQAVALWNRILDAVPGAELVLNVERALTLPEYFKIFDKIDIVLDTFPYNGTTTICDALYMGVPVVTLQGDRTCARVGASLLTHIGLSEFIATNEDDYVRIAAEAARDRVRLNALRTGLRARFLASPLGNPRFVVGDLEAFYSEALERA